MTQTTVKKDSHWENGNGYDRYIQAEFSSFRKEAWRKQIEHHFPENDKLDILDVGTGPGFFACILSEDGHRVVAIDQSEGMLGCARKNAEKLGVEPNFIQMDVNELSFEDESFDVVVSRNVTWTLEYPEHVYTMFKQVLRTGGTAAYL